MKRQFFLKLNISSFDDMVLGFILEF